MTKLLFISNGYGEDTIAASIIKCLQQKDKNLEFSSVPLVGKGLAYHELGIDTLGSGLSLPSGGLIPADYFKNIIKDIKAGLIQLTYQQIKLICRASKEADLIVLVGDAYPVVLGWLFTKKLRSIFIGTAKSNYFCPYSKLEKWLFKKYCYKVFTRDEVTAVDLKNSNIDAGWLGNAMMDSLTVLGQNFGANPDQVFIGILPGSRDQTYRDFPVILRTVEELFKKINNSFIVTALAPSISFEKISSIAREEWWIPKVPDAQEEANGIIGKLEHESGMIYFTNSHFGDVINNAKIIIGQAGTGNEQAAGLGKPVVAFDKCPENPGWYRLRQKGLLGDALEIVEDNSEVIAEEVSEILEDKERYDRMSKTGKERMGPAGAVKKIAEAILKSVSGS